MTELLWLIRESAQPSERVAINGMYQHSMQKDAKCRLLRVSLSNGGSLFPEISGSQHRFTVRFLEWSTVDSRAIQTGHRGRRAAIGRAGELCGRRPAPGRLPEHE